MVKRRLRFAMIISSEEWSISPRDMRRDFMAELLMIGGYIGAMHDETNGAEWFIFGDPEASKEAAAKAKRIGFESAGPVTDPQFIENAALRMPQRQRTYRRYIR